MMRIAVLSFCPLYVCALSPAQAADRGGRGPAIDPDDEDTTVAGAPRRGARRALAALTAAALLGPATAFPEDALPAGDAPVMAEEAANAAARAPEFETGRVFRDCPHCPEMVVVPAGSFMMGSPETEEGRWDDEGPVRRVTIRSPFAVGVHEVTFAEWDACASAGGCRRGYRPDDEGWGRGRRPAINVSWDDAQAYVEWLSRETGASYRLLSESEWEYVARAGTTTRYWWGDDIGRNRANCDGCGTGGDGVSTDPVGRFGANAFGLHDVHGNVWEWVQDCGEDGCSIDVLRGGSWSAIPRNLRAANRIWVNSGSRSVSYGFRVARTLIP